MLGLELTLKKKKSVVVLTSQFKLVLFACWASLWGNWGKPWLLGFWELMLASYLISVVLVQ